MGMFLEEKSYSKMSKKLRYKPIHPYIVVLQKATKLSGHKHQPFTDKTKPVSSPFSLFITNSLLSLSIIVADKQKIIYFCSSFSK